MSLTPASCANEATGTCIQSAARCLPPDVRAWLLSLDHINRDQTHITHYIGLIIEPDGRDSFGNYQATRVNAWMVSRDKHGHPICERGNVERLP